jgi:hypothetical protein
VNATLHLMEGFQPHCANSSDYRQPSLECEKFILRTLKALAPEAVFVSPRGKKASGDKKDE